MIAMNTALLTNEEPLSRCNGKGADVVNKYDRREALSIGKGCQDSPKTRRPQEEAV